MVQGCTFEFTIRSSQAKHVIIIGKHFLWKPSACYYTYQMSFPNSSFVTKLFMKMGFNVVLQHLLRREASAFNLINHQPTAPYPTRASLNTNPTN